MHRTRDGSGFGVACKLTLVDGHVPGISQAAVAPVDLPERLRQHVREAAWVRHQRVCLSRAAQARPSSRERVDSMHRFGCILGELEG
jgi:hypothetical protein